jgi:hypothetical protein
MHVERQDGRIACVSQMPVTASLEALESVAGQQYMHMGRRYGRHGQTGALMCLADA